MIRNVRHESAFTLVELMVTVVIIGLLATMGIQQFRVFIIRSKQAEAKQNLALLYTLQMSYHGEMDKFAGAGVFLNTAAPTACNVANDLGYGVTPCEKVRYQYWISSPTAETFVAFAREIIGAPGTYDRRVGTCLIPGFPPTNIRPGVQPLDASITQDLWVINEKKTLTNPTSPVPYFNAADVFDDPLVCN